MILSEAEEKLVEVEAEYSSKGYSVVIRPASAELPEFLRPFRPDLIATKQGEKVVVQLKSPSAADMEAITQLAEALEQRPDWRLEVIFMSPPVAPDVPAREDLASEEQVTRLLTNAEVLAAQGQVEAAVLLAWSATENILRRSARTVAPEMERQSSARVLKHLYSLGLFGQDTYEKLSLLMEFRNVVAHGFQPRRDPPSVADAVSEIRRLRSAA